MTEIPRAEHGYFLLSLEEPDVNELRIVLIEAARGPHAPTRLGHVHEMTTEPRAPHYEVFWSDYVAYAVRNERFAAPIADASPETPHLRKRAGSAFLAYVAAASGDLPASLDHWEMACLGHVIDVASTSAPMVSRML